MNIETNTPTIYIVDDDASVRESLSSLIRSAGMNAVVFDSPFKFLEIPDLADLSCAIIDIRMPELDGLSLQEVLNQQKKNIPIIFITGHGDVPLAVRAMKAGAVDFLNKPFDDTALLKSIASALSNLSLLSHKRTELKDLKKRFSELTSREQQIVVGVAQGKRNKQIAYEYGITESTIKVHKHNAMQKLRVKSVAELTLAVENLKNLNNTNKPQ